MLLFKSIVSGTASGFKSIIPVYLIRVYLFLSGVGRRRKNVSWVLPKVSVYGNPRAASAGVATLTVVDDLWRTKRDAIISAAHTSVLSWQMSSMGSNVRFKVQLDKSWSWSVAQTFVHDCLCLLFFDDADTLYSSEQYMFYLCYFCHPIEKSSAQGKILSLSLQSLLQCVSKDSIRICKSRQDAVTSRGV